MIMSVENFIESEEVYSVIKFNQLEGTERIDAEFYSPEYMKILNKLKGLNHSRIGEFCFVTSGSTPPDRDPDLKEGIILLKTANIRDGYIDADDPFFINERLNERLKTSKLRSGDVLINIVGATLDVIGRVALVPDNFPGANITQAISLIRIENPDFLPEYLFAFLYSDYGRKQVSRTARPTAQYNLNHEETKSIIIPKMSKTIQNKIKSSYLDFWKFYNESINLYSNAKNLLLEELNIKLTDFTQDELFNISKGSEVVKADRFDAEYFQPFYKKLEDYLIDKFNAVLIGDIDFIDITTGQYSKEYVTNGNPYIRGTDLANGTISIENLVYINPKHQKESKKAKEGDVVVTRVGTIGLAARIPAECDGGTISDNLIRLRFNQEQSRFNQEYLDSYYLSLYLASPIGVNLMVKNSRGSVQKRLNQETLKEIVVPILSKKKQQKIALMVQQSHEAKKKSKELLEKTKRKIETEIEKL